MGLPDGWVTDVPGLTRNEQLTLLGNGVVPQQAVAAYRLLTNRASASRITSDTVTPSASARATAAPHTSSGTRTVRRGVWVSDDGIETRLTGVVPGDHASRVGDSVDGDPADGTVGLDETHRQQLASGRIIHGRDARLGSVHESERSETDEANRVHGSDPDDEARVEMRDRVRDVLADDEVNESTDGHGVVPAGAGDVDRDGVGDRGRTHGVCHDTNVTRVMTPGTTYTQDRRPWLDGLPSRDETGQTPPLWDDEP
jgi:hypothetical protein